MKILLPLVVVILTLLFDQSHCSPKEDALTCLACKNTIEFLSEVTHYTDKSLVDGLGVFYSRIFRIISKDADNLAYDFVRKMLPQLFEFLNQRVNKYTICSDIDACPYYGDNGISEINAKPSKDPLHCVACIYASDIIKVVFADTPIEMTNYFMIRICSYMQGFKEECAKIVKDNLRIIAKFATEKFVPEKLCRSLKLCVKSQTFPLLKDNAVSYNPISAAELINILPVNFTLPTDNQPESDECDICHSLVLFLKYLQEQYPELTDDQIMNALGLQCAIYVEKTKLMCKRIVSKYGRELILIQHNNPDPDIDPCAMVGLCIDHNALLAGNLTTTKPNV